MNGKLRRHSGRVTPRLVKGVKKEHVIELALEPQPMWDDWKDHRDGMRGSRDRTLLRRMSGRTANYFQLDRWNKRLKRLIQRRKVRKAKLSSF